MDLEQSRIVHVLNGFNSILCTQISNKKFRAHFWSRYKGEYFPEEKSIWRRSGGKK